MTAADHRSCFERVRRGCPGHRRAGVIGAACGRLREQDGFFVEAVRLTRMPMIVTDAGLPGNPIIYANNAFIALSGYSLDNCWVRTRTS